VVELTCQPAFDSAPVSFALLLQVYRKGELGSPRVSGSTNASKARFTPGCDCSIPGRPAPGRRIRCRSMLFAPNSSRPRRIVTRDRPVAADTKDSPPYPIARASAAAHRRRPRSIEYWLDGYVLLNHNGFKFQVASHAAI
jgi:hypothetical protein